ALAVRHQRAQRRLAEPSREPPAAGRAAAQLAARLLQHAAVRDARRAHRLARAAAETVVEVLDQRIAGGDASLVQAVHQVDAAALVPSGHTLVTRSRPPVRLSLAVSGWSATIRVPQPWPRAPFVRGGSGCSQRSDSGWRAATSRSSSSRAVWPAAAPTTSSST